MASKAAACGTAPPMMGHLAVTDRFSRSITSTCPVSASTTNILGVPRSSAIPAGVLPSSLMLPKYLLVLVSTISTEPLVSGPADDATVTATYKSPDAES